MISPISLLFTFFPQNVFHCTNTLCFSNCSLASLTASAISKLHHILVDDFTMDPWQGRTLLLYSGGHCHCCNLLYLCNKKWIKPYDPNDRNNSNESQNGFLKTLILDNEILNSFLKTLWESELLDPLDLLDLLPQLLDSNNNFEVCIIIVLVTLGVWRRLAARSEAASQTWPRYH